MSTEQLESSILALPSEERRRLAIWFDEHRNELLGEPLDESLTSEQQAEILRRRELALAHPDMLEPWDGTIERLRQRLHDIRHQETAAR